MRISVNGKSRGYQFEKGYPGNESTLGRFQQSNKKYHTISSSAVEGGWVGEAHLDAEHVLTTWSPARSMATPNRKKGERRFFSPYGVDPSLPPPPLFLPPAHARDPAGTLLQRSALSDVGTNLTDDSSHAVQFN